MNWWEISSSSCLEDSLLESSNYTTSTTQDAGRDPYVDPVVVKGCSGVAALEATEVTETRQGPGDEGHTGADREVGKECWQFRYRNCHGTRRSGGHATRS